MAGASKQHTYVIQVAAGRESHVRTLVRNTLPADICPEVFAPRCVRRVRRQGEWRAEERLLTPGYLYLRTADLPRAAELLREVPALTRLLRSADSIQPLDEAEEAWLASLTTPGDRTVGMSYGVAEGDRVVVTDGPLAGHESLIARVDRHKRLAYLELHILGRTKVVRVGLEVVSRAS